MSPRTTFLSKLIGLYCVLGSVSMLLRHQSAVALVNALIHNPPALFIVSVITLLAGLAIILSHNVWSGGVLPITVTLVGWLALVKGLLFMFLSPAAAAGVLERLGFEQLFYTYAVVLLILGGWLTYRGFRSASQ